MSRSDPAYPPSDFADKYRDLEYLPSDLEDSLRDLEYPPTEPELAVDDKGVYLWTSRIISGSSRREEVEFQCTFFLRLEGALWPFRLSNGATGDLLLGDSGEDGGLEEEW